MPVSATGEPIKPPPEKSFIQKYWIYLLIALVGICELYLDNLLRVSTNNVPVCSTVRWCSRRRARLQRGSAEASTTLELLIYDVPYLSLHLDR